MKSKLNLECLSERITPSAGIVDPGVTRYLVPTANSIGRPQDQRPSSADIAGSGAELIVQLNDPSIKASGQLLDLKKNEDAQAIAYLSVLDSTMTPAERLVAGIEFMALVVEREKLIDRLAETVAEYKDVLSNLQYYNYNYFGGYGIDFGPIPRLPNGYEFYETNLDTNDPNVV